MTTDAAVVADIGGTNARFAIYADGGLHSPWSKPCNALNGPRAAIEAFLQEAAPQKRPARIALAVAGPADPDRAEMTNRAWSFSVPELTALGFRQALLLNDFAALALSLRRLGGTQLEAIGSARDGAGEGPLAVVGAGTGLGVAALIPGENGDIALQTEGGHIGFAPQDEVEVAILSLLSQESGRVSAEHVISGPGLVRLHRALGEMNGRTASETDARAIVDRAHSDPACLATVERFWAIFASFCGDAALAYGARGGLFIGGGVAPRLRPFLDAVAFRARFEAKGDFNQYNRSIPTWLVTDPFAALRGAAAALDRAALG